MKEDLFKDIYPDVDLFLKELVSEGSPPEGLQLSRAPEIFGYNSPGEMSDWIMAATGITTITPEIGTKDKCSETFFIKTLQCITDTLDAQYPLVKTTFKKIGSQIDIHGTKFNSNQANLKISNKGLSTASDTWITLNSSSKFNLEAVNAYDPFTYDKDPRGKKIELSLKKLSNEEFSHVIQIPKLHSRRYLNIELIGDMKDVKSLDFSYKEYNTDVSMKK